MKFVILLAPRILRKLVAFGELVYCWVKQCDMRGYGGQEVGTE
jgi:hypothetical protein